MNDPVPSRPIQIQSLSPATSFTRPAPSVLASIPTFTSSVPVLAPAPPVIERGASPAKGSWLTRYWKKVGGGSLLLSLLIHAVFVIVAFFIVQTISTEDRVDFLPGGGGKAGNEASQQISEQVTVKKHNLLREHTPVQRLASLNGSNSLLIPDAPSEDAALPEMNNLLGGGGSMGVGASGAGGGFGSGFGSGGMKGFTGNPVVMFGRDLQVRSIAVVLDVSGSMTKHLAHVVKELDRVAKGSPVVLYVGCGIMPIPPKTHIDDDAIETIRSLKTKDPAKNFEIFWRRSHGQDGYEPPKKGEPGSDVPEQEVYDIFASRPRTYFIKSQGIQYAWTALVCNEVRHAEAVYWFSDFQDAVEAKQLKRTGDTLRRRKQKLFMHASETGNSFTQVRDDLVKPTGGDVIADPNPDKK